MTSGIADLAGVKAKLRRAKEHQSTLKAEFDIWGKQQTHLRGFHIRRDDSWYVVMAEPLPQPDIRFSIIVGDLIHNLRSALDHLVWQLVLRDGQEPSRWNEFPIYDCKQRFLDEVKFRKRHPERGVLYGITVDSDAWAIIEKAQPCISPDPRTNLIGVIGRFSNMDKHRTLCVQIPFADKISEAIGWNPQAILLEERIGVLALSFEKPTELIRYRFANQPDPNVHVKGGLPIDPTFGEGSIEGGYQLSIGTFIGLISSVTQIVDKVAQLPRVLDIRL